MVTSANDDQSANASAIRNTAALLEELSRAPNRFTSGREELSIKLIEQVAASGEGAAIPSLLNLLFDRSARIASAAANGLAQLVAQAAPGELAAIDEDVRTSHYWGIHEAWTGRAHGRHCPI